MQWQHGTFTVNDNGSLTLTPYALDGRQLLSDPCKSDVGHYTIYNQTEYFRVRHGHLCCQRSVADVHRSPFPSTPTISTTSSASISSPSMGLP